RCGVLVVESGPGDVAGARAAGGDLTDVPAGARTLASVVRATGAQGAAVARLLGPALIVETFDEARALARTVAVPVATLAGDVFHGAGVVEGGARQDARGILETRAEVASLRDEVAAASDEVKALGAALADLDVQIGDAQARVAGLTADLHTHEKTIVGLDGQTQRASDEHGRVSRRQEMIATERARADAEHDAADRRREESVAAISAHQLAMREAEETLGAVLGRLQQAREASEAAMRLVTESRTEQATLVERASGLDAELARLEEAARDLDARIVGRRADIERTETRRAALRTSIAETRTALDTDVRTLDDLKTAMRDADERLTELRQEFSGREQAIRGARHVLDDVRSEVSQADVARARATADLAHLGEACVEAVGATLDEVAGAVRQMQAEGALVAAADTATAQGEEDEGDEAPQEAGATDGAESGADRTAAPAAADIDPDAIIAVVRRKIEKLGPVNMMAIEQFDELETRHAFLTTQRADLLDSIAQTGEAIKKIDKTTRERFTDAFASINAHFEKTFTTLFGGGRAGLVLIDQENDEESGIDIIAQPPGKRLQNVQLLSGGEKALTAMALMFAVFKHRPSPFCLLDEIDAPLDDANIGRFIEMLQGMQEHTQFILITHNRKTMEIADRLYGVTMEEPGVSKLISLQLN
ncbi:MAG TPA: hypothetical protein VHB78_06065, partial [Vicinamibacterales bacterium]|nr:hypothetical protein [Vicinamibacterales bacterium]